MAKSFRIERVNQTVRQVLGQLALTELKDPRIGLVTITEVRVSSDLASARVHFSVMGDEEVRKKTLAGLISAKQFMRREVGRALRIHTAPDLRFVYDDSLDRAMRIDEKLHEAGLDGTTPAGGGEPPATDATGATPAPGASETTGAADDAPAHEAGEGE